MILSDPSAEAVALVEAGRQRGLTVRLIGGTAIRHYAGAEIPPSLDRTPKDVDVVIQKTDRRALSAMLAERGYRPEERFNATQGDRRMLFRDDANGRQLDVFIDVFEMCHSIDLSKRLAVDDTAIPAAELLITKLQIVQLNAKDVSDTMLLLASREPTEDDTGISIHRLQFLCGRSWGLTHTLSLNLEHIQGYVSGFDLPEATKSQITSRTTTLEQVIDDCPKSLRWRVRSLFGESIRWAEEPEDTE